MADLIGRGLESTPSFQDSLWWRSLIPQSGKSATEKLLLGVEPLRPYGDDRLVYSLPG